MPAEDKNDLIRPWERKISRTLLWRGLILLLAFTLVGSATALQCIPPPANLVGWWSGEGNADDIIGTNNGTLQNGVTFAPGIVGQAFQLNGVNQFIELPPTNELYNPVTGFTWDAWVRPAAVGEMVVLGAADTVGCEDRVLGIGGFAEVGIPPDHVLAHVDSIGECGARDFLSAPVPGGIQIGADYHLALTVDYAHSVAHLYVNGQQVVVKSLTGTPIARNMPVTIGAFRDGGSLILQFNGLIDEVEIYNRPLTGQEIQDIFNAGSAGKCKAITVEIDIHPGSFPNSNSINPRSKGVIPVAILSTKTFNATTVDPLSVRFGPNGATAEHGRGHNEDVNRDGKTDLVLHFRTQDTGIVCGNTSVSLTGKTFSGQAIKGSSSIRTVGCNHEHEHEREHKR